MVDCLVICNDIQQTDLLLALHVETLKVDERVKFLNLFKFHEMKE